MFTLANENFNNDCVQILQFTKDYYNGNIIVKYDRGTFRDRREHNRARRISHAAILSCVPALICRQSRLVQVIKQ
jgi:hypothetical protein